MKTHLLPAGVLLAAGLLAAPGVSLLAGQASTAAPIFLAIPETFPDVDARVVIVREPGRDIVLLDPGDATAETLSVALNVLGRVDRPRPVQGRAQMIPVTGFVLRGELPSEKRERLESALARLREKPVAQIGNLGPGRWMPYIAP
jgi:hypothetical protein